jgi:hypothetical protein
MRARFPAVNTDSGRAAKRGSRSFQRFGLIQDAHPLLRWEWGCVETLVLVLPACVTGFVAVAFALALPTGLAGHSGASAFALHYSAVRRVVYVLLRLLHFRGIIRQANAQATMTFGAWSNRDLVGCVWGEKDETGRIPEIAGTAGL